MKIPKKVFYQCLFLRQNSPTTASSYSHLTFIDLITLNVTNKDNFINLLLKQFYGVFLFLPTPTPPVLSPTPRSRTHSEHVNKMETHALTQLCVMWLNDWVADTGILEIKVKVVNNTKL